MDERQQLQDDSALDLDWAQPQESPRRRVPIVLLLGLGLLVLLGGAYGADLLTSRGAVPRGTAVAGINVGGMSQADAEAALRAGFEPRATAPVQVQAADLRTQLDPMVAGLGIDWAATLGQVGAQPLNPLTRLKTYFDRTTTRQIDLVLAVDPARLDAAVTALRTQVDRPAVEGAITFAGATPKPVAPVNGQVLDVAQATSAVRAQWFSGNPVTLAVQSQPVTVTAEGVQAALTGVANPAVAGPITVTGKNGAQAVLTARQIAAALTFAPDGKGGLAPALKPDAVTAALGPQLSATEIQPVDAAVRLVAGRPTVVPAVDGAVVDLSATIGDPLAFVTTGPRTVAAVYIAKPAAFTTAAANALGINEVIGEFTTGGFADASGVNIRRVAEQVQGALVKPGDTFSLNGYTGTRGLAQGYVDSGIILNGRPANAVGGGISQFATTLFNASYFAGMTDVAHQEHSYYISRYPEAREATVYEGAIDLVFKVPTQTGVMIQTIGTQSDITVRIWGTKTVNVQSITGSRSSYTDPNTLRLPAGPDCVPATGGRGFTTSDTRVITNAKTGQELSRNTRTVRYDSHPNVVCEQPAAAPAPAAPPTTAPAPAPAPRPGG